MGAGFAAMRQSRTRWLGGLAAAVTLVSLAGATGILIRHRDTNQDLRQMRECALELARQVPPGGSIVVNGGPLRDEHGHPIAHNASMVFAWMDTEGGSTTRPRTSAPRCSSASPPAVAATGS